MIAKENVTCQTCGQDGSIMIYKSGGGTGSIFICPRCVSTARQNVNHVISILKAHHDPLCDCDSCEVNRQCIKLLEAR